MLGWVGQQEGCFPQRINDLATKTLRSRAEGWLDWPGGSLGALNPRVGHSNCRLGRPLLDRDHSRESKVRLGRRLRIW